eukprot:1957879-Rhodomonas_salina.1
MAGLVSRDRGGNTSGTCPLCGKQVEMLQHIHFECAELKGAQSEVHNYIVTRAKLLTSLADLLPDSESTVHQHESIGSIWN